MNDMEIRIRLLYELIEDTPHTYEKYKDYIKKESLERVIISYKKEVRTLLKQQEKQLVRKCIKTYDNGDCIFCITLPPDTTLDKAIEYCSYYIEGDPTFSFNTWHKILKSPNRVAIYYDCNFNW